MLVKCSPIVFSSNRFIQKTIKGDISNLLKLKTMAEANYQTCS